VGEVLLLWVLEVVQRFGFWQLKFWWICGGITLVLICISLMTNNIIYSNVFLGICISFMKHFSHLLLTFYDLKKFYWPGASGSHL
jgi:hypothetical protein